MRYNPEAAKPFIDAGEYEAVVKIANDKYSAAGNEMVELILTCYGPNGRTVDVFDHLVAVDAFQWKVKHFCDAAGLDYGRGALSASECTGRNVRVQLIVEKHPKYGEQNKVSDYLPRDGQPATMPEHDQDIPF